jgi:hypothetical protein
MLRRAVLFLAAVAIFVLGLGLLAILFNTPSGREKEGLERMRREEAALARAFDVVVMREGFAQRRSGRREIYIPSLLVRASNMSEATSEPVTLRAEFLRKGSIFCGASGGVPVLKAGENTEIWLKCIEATGFGSVARGLSLAETTEPVEYVIFLESSRARVSVVRDTLRTAFF